MYVCMYVLLSMYVCTYVDMEMNTSCDTAFVYILRIYFCFDSYTCSRFFYSAAMMKV